jgi:hypothetical protein
LLAITLLLLASAFIPCFHLPTEIKSSKSIVAAVGRGEKKGLMIRNMILRHLSPISATIRPSARNFASTPTPQSNNNSGNALWQKLKAPSIFGVGLYLGLVVFGGGEKEEAAIFTEMKWKMIGGDKK